MTPSLTLSYVKSTMDALILQNGKTSTLEIKLEMRKNGVFCDQTEVHALVEEVFDLDPTAYSRELINKTYYEYSAPVLGNSIPVVNSAGATSNTPTPTAKTGSNTLLSGDTPKMSFVKSELVTLKQYPHQEDWIVYSTDEKKYSVFDKSLTRDKVRSRFATINKVKIQEVRARRINNLD